MSGAWHHQALFDQAKNAISAKTLVSSLRQLIDIPSPTGNEAGLAKHISTMLTDFGLVGTEQIIDNQQSNAMGHIPGSDQKFNLLLYAPIDTVTSSSADEDLPWVAPELRDDMVAHSYVENEHVFGLGAHNPKGHAACILEAGRVIRELGIPLAGRLTLGFGAGGMPTNARPGTRPNSGHGAGCDYMLSNMPKPDCALIAKSGWAISWEEVGLVWFEVEVEGTHTYVGSRHLFPYTSAIINAGKLIERIDNWFGEWTEQHKSGLVAPQGVVSFIQSGWERMPAFTPASCRFRLDLRLSPRTTPAQAEEAFAKALQTFSTALEINTSFKTLVAIPGTTTDPNELIIKRAIRSWQAVSGQAPHVALQDTSGATDANILRGHDIPTARVGLPKANIKGMDFQLGMNAVATSDLVKLTTLLVHLVIDLCAPQAGRAEA